MHVLFLQELEAQDPFMVLVGDGLLKNGTFWFPSLWTFV